MLQELRHGQMKMIRVSQFDKQFVHHPQTHQPSGKVVETEYSRSTEGIKAEVPNHRATWYGAGPHKQKDFSEKKIF